MYREPGASYAKNVYLEIPHINILEAVQHKLRWQAEMDQVSFIARKRKWSGTSMYREQLKLSRMRYSLTSELQEVGGSGETEASVESSSEESSSEEEL